MGEGELFASLAICQQKKKKKMLKVRFDIEGGNRVVPYMKRQSMHDSTY